MRHVHCESAHPRIQASEAPIEVSDETAGGLQSGEFGSTGAWWIVYQDSDAAGPVLDKCGRHDCLPQHSHLLLVRRNENA